MDESIFDIAGLTYQEPKQEEKAALIGKLQSGDFKLSYSSLTAFTVSPKAFISYKLQERKTTDAMLLGEVVHGLVLEPEKFAERYHVAPDVNAATAEGKNEWGKLLEDFTGAAVQRNKAGNCVIPKVSEIIDIIYQNQGVRVLPAKVAEEGKRRANAVIKNRACRSVLERITETETPIEWQFMGINFTGKIDGKGDGLYFDLKNVPDACLDSAQKAIWGRRLHWQAAGYMMNDKRKSGSTYFVVCVDGQGETSVHAFNDAHIDRAKRQMEKYVWRFKECVLESFTNPDVWDESQDFWLKSELNQFGINYL